MKSAANRRFFPTNRSIVLSVIIHCIVLIFLIIFDIKSIYSNNKNIIIVDFINTQAKDFNPGSPKTDSKITKKFSFIEDIFEDDEILPDVKITGYTKDSLLIAKDSIPFNPNWPKNPPNEYEFIHKHLDSILINHPGLRKFILSEYSKSLSEEALPFTKSQKQLDTYLLDFLRKNYPEGADYGIYEKLNPGMNFPIDKFIDLIKKL